MWKDKYSLGREHPLLLHGSRGTKVRALARGALMGTSLLELVPGKIRNTHRPQETGTGVMVTSKRKNSALWQKRELLLQGKSSTITKHNAKQICSNMCPPCGPFLSPGTLLMKPSLRPQPKAFPAALTWSQMSSHFFSLSYCRSSRALSGGKFMAFCGEREREREGPRRARAPAEPDTSKPR